MKSPVHALALLIAVAFVWGVIHVFGVQFAEGSAYPRYSTLRADPGGAQQQRDGVCPRSGADGERRAAGGGKLGLERLELGAEDVPPARCHARERILHCAGVLARPQIEEWDPGSSSHRAGAGAEPGTYRSKCAR